MSALDFAPQVHALDLAPVKDALTSALSAAYDWVRWAGHSVVELSKQGLDLAIEGLYKLAQLVGVLWNASKPHLQKLLQFIQSNAGICGIAVFISVVLLHSALNLLDEDDRFAKYGLAVLSYGTLAFAAVYGAQTNVLPPFFNHLKV